MTTNKLIGITAAMFLGTSSMAYAQAAQTGQAADQTQAQQQAQTQQVGDRQQFGVREMTDQDITRRLEHGGYENIEIQRENGHFTGTARRYGEDIDLRVDARTGRVTEPARLTPGQVQYRLEQEGYTEIGDVEDRDGEFRVTAQRFGEEQDLRISPRTGHVMDPRELTADQLTGMLEEHEYQNVMLFEREDEFGHQMAVGELDGERFLLEIHPTRGEIIRERAMMN